MVNAPTRDSSARPIPRSRATHYVYAAYASCETDQCANLFFCPFFLQFFCSVHDLPKRWPEEAMWLINNMPIIERELNESASCTGYTADV